MWIAQLISPVESSCQSALGLCNLRPEYDAPSVSVAMLVNLFENALLCFNLPLVPFRKLTVGDFYSLQHTFRKSGHAGMLQANSSSP
jgi:hypothetical protein